MTFNDYARSSHQRWAELRFSVVGPLMAQPMELGDLKLKIEELAAQYWRHPTTGEAVKFGSSTIERWYYRVKKKQLSPLDALRTKPREDIGKTRVLHPEVASWLNENYREHPSWSRKLHCDNLRVWIENHPEPPGPPMPSYSSVVRYMRRKGFWKLPRARSPNSPSKAQALERLEKRETRRFEVEYVGALWHLDFHHGSRQVVTGDGRLVTPLCLCIIDDHSRLVCHLQWYLHEDAKTLIHGFTQALQKRGMPRMLMSDNGSAMISGEFTSGLLRLGITHELTLEYSPHQNGKQESFWGILEGRLMAMLEGEKTLSLTRLNQVSQAWVEREYNRTVHSETGVEPIERFIRGKDVLRPVSSDLEALTLLFRRNAKRRTKRSDGTISLEGKRFEIPSAYRTLVEVVVRYAKWDLSHVDIVDPRTDKSLSPIYPVDLAKNASAKRRVIGSDQTLKTHVPLIEHKKSEVPLLTKLIAEYSATGLPPAYIPMPEDEQ